MTASQQRRRRQWLRSRPSERRRAGRGGFFWLPCPLCGTRFGGHEWRWGHTIPSGFCTDRAICPPCAYELGEAFEGICRDYGHDVVEFQLLVSGQWVARCLRCLLEFDAATRAAIGRPLVLDRPRLFEASTT